MIKTLDALNFLSPAPLVACRLILRPNRTRRTRLNPDDPYRDDRALASPEARQTLVGAAATVILQ